MNTSMINMFREFPCFKPRSIGQPSFLHYRHYKALQPTRIELGTIAYQQWQYNESCSQYLYFVCCKYSVQNNQDTHVSDTWMMVCTDLRAMLLHMNFFGPVAVHGDPTAYKQPCEEAYRDFLAWKRTHKVSSSQRKFTFWSVFKEEYGCYMNSKGHNSRVLSAWLEDVLDRATSMPPPGLLHDNRLYTCVVTLIPSSRLMEAF